MVAPRLKDFEITILKVQEWKTSPWLEKILILKFTVQKCPQIEGFSRTRAPRLKDFPVLEWMTSPWLKKIYKFTVQKRPMIERISRARVRLLPWSKKILKFTVLKCPQIEEFSCMHKNDFIMVEENFEIHWSEVPLYWRIFIRIIGYSHHPFREMQ